MATLYWFFIFFLFIILLKKNYSKNKNNLKDLLLWPLNVKLNLYLYNYKKVTYLYHTIFLNYNLHHNQNLLYHFKKSGIGHAHDYHNRKLLEVQKCTILSKIINQKHK